MPNPAITHAYAQVERAARAAVEAAINAHGVPTSPSEALELSEQLFDFVVEQRQKQWAIQAAAISAKHPEVEIPSVREYKLEYLYRLVMRAAGMKPSKAMPVSAAMLDEATAAYAAVRHSPFTAPLDDGAKLATVTRIFGGIARHSRQAGREMVLDTARMNNMRWARQLSGSENCAFCAMLVSRGAAYWSEDNASFRAHDNCDCTAVLVPAGVADFSPQALAMRKKWDKARADSGDMGWKTTLAEFRRQLDEKPGTVKKIARLPDYEKMAA